MTLATDLGPDATVTLVMPDGYLLFSFSRVDKYNRPTAIRAREKGLQ